MANLMTLLEVKKCDFAYVLYEVEDPQVHCFIRMQTTPFDIWFDRPIPGSKNGVITGSYHSQPHLLIEKYGQTWFAYDSAPTQWQINAHKDVIDHER